MSVWDSDRYFIPSLAYWGGGLVGFKGNST